MMTHYSFLLALSLLLLATTQTYAATSKKTEHNIVIKPLESITNHLPAFLAYMAPHGWRGFVDIAETTNNEHKITASYDLGLLLCVLKNAEAPDQLAIDKTLLRAHLLCPTIINPLGQKLFSKIVSEEHNERKTLRTMVHAALHLNFDAWSTELPLKKIFDKNTATLQLLLAQNETYLSRINEYPELFEVSPFLKIQELEKNCIEPSITHKKKLIKLPTNRPDFFFVYVMHKMAGLRGTYDQLCSETNPEKLEAALVQGCKNAQNYETLFKKKPINNYKEGYLLWGALQNPHAGKIVSTILDATKNTTFLLNAMYILRTHYPYLETLPLSLANTAFMYKNWQGLEALLKKNAHESFADLKKLHVEKTFIADESRPSIASLVPSDLKNSALQKIILESTDPWLTVTTTPLQNSSLHDAIKPLTRKQDMLIKFLPFYDLKNIDPDRYYLIQQYLSKHNSPQTFWHMVVTCLRSTSFVDSFMNCTRNEELFEKKSRFYALAEIDASNTSFLTQKHTADIQNITEALLNQYTAKESQKINEGLVAFKDFFKQYQSLVTTIGEEEPPIKKARYITT